MSIKTVYLAWQDKEMSRQWFPVGRLDAEINPPLYRFRYIEGAKRAHYEAGFPPLIEFPELYKVYESTELFPLFQNRVINGARPDFADYLSYLGLSDRADPIEILSATGGSRVTDAYEVFPKLEKDEEGSFDCRFFLHGWRHVNQPAQERIERLEADEPLYVTLELANPETGFAVQIQTEDYHMIGWAPRYLVDDLVEAMAPATAVTESQGDYCAKVIRVNPLPAPSKQRVLIQMSGRWDTHKPMSSEVFSPLRRLASDSTP